MKTSIWDILAGFLGLGVILVLVFTTAIFANPSVPLNPFPPATTVPTVFVPSPTLTSTTAAAVSLPPTWTPTVGIEPTRGATSTRPPTSTPFPTRTPFILPSPTAVVSTVVPTNERLPLAGQCTVVKQTPVDGTSFAPGAEFTTNWTLENTSDTRWDSGNVDLKFMAGDAMYKNTSSADLPVSVDPGKNVDISVTMIAASSPGYHITYWNLQSGSTVLCTFYVEIIVK